MTISSSQKQSSRLTSYTVITSVVALAMLGTCIWFTQASVPTTGKIGLSILCLVYIPICGVIIHAIFLGTLDRAMTYTVIVGGLVLAWHTVWLIIFGSPANIWGWLDDFQRIDWALLTEENGFWFREYAPFYFIWLPLAIPAVALVFGWYARAFCKEHPVRFLAILLAAFSPAVFIVWVDTYFPKVYL